MKLSEIERAYIAGLFDGEGCIRLGYALNGQGEERKVKHFWIQISNTDANIIAYLKERIGGTSYSTPNGIGRKRLFGWKLYHQNAVDFLELIVPYLRIKREKALLILNNWEIVLRPTREEQQKQQLIALSEKMRTLNRRGVYEVEELTPRNVALGTSKPLRSLFAEAGIL